MVVSNMVLALFLREEIDKVVPAVGEKHAGASRVVRPFELEIADSEDAADDEAADAFGVRLGVGEGEGGAPGAAEDHVPFADREVFAEGFDV